MTANNMRVVGHIWVTDNTLNKTFLGRLVINDQPSFESDYYLKKNFGIKYAVIGRNRDAYNDLIYRIKGI